MRNILILLLALTMLASCEGNLSEDQRKALNEEMEDRKIKKISQEQIYEKALDEGRRLVKSVNPFNMDSIKGACKCEISTIKTKEGLTEIERRVYEAYEFNPSGTDNIHKEGDQFLIYTKPKTANDSLTGIWLIKFPKSEIVKKI